MALSRTELAARLRQAREQVGVTQAEVAAALGLHRPSISEIEAGRRAVSSEELFRFARLYATSVMAFLSESLPATADVTRVLFRKDGITTPRVRVATQRFMERCRAVRELEQILEIARPQDARPAYQPGTMTTKGDAIRQGDRIAADERRRLDLGREPIRDPLALLEAQGVTIGELDGLDDEDRIDGLFFELDGVGPCVGVNPRRDDMTGFRMSFTAAHEYAHWLMRDVTVEHFTFEDRPDVLHEVRANAFAAAFLMPAEGLHTYFAAARLLVGDAIPHLDRADIVRAMDHFGVSRTALLWRLQNCKLLAEERASALREDQFSIRQVATALGTEFRRLNRVRGRLPALAVEAWRRGLISTGRAADLYGVSIEDYQGFMRLMGETQEPGDSPLLGAAAR